MHHDSQKNISYHNFHLFFPICDRKEFKLFQFLTIFDILLKKKIQKLQWPLGKKESMACFIHILGGI